MTNTPNRLHRATRVLVKHPRAAIAGAIALTCLGAGGALWACADTTCTPNWQLSSSDYECGGRAVISPGNDTRINLLMLMRSLRLVEDKNPSPAHDPNNPQFGSAFMTWQGLRATYWPETPSAVQEEEPASICEASAGVEDAFAAALAADRSVPDPERATLRRLRAQTGCSDIAVGETGITSKAGLEYLSYLKAAEAFHKGDWPTARQAFATLTKSRAAWVAETAKYMPIRIGLRAAIEKAVDDYGDFAGPDKTDPVALAEARSAIAAYLKAYPKGLYADSAQGLTRRVAWLGGDMAALTRSYENLLATTPGDDEAAAYLAEEIDIKLLEREDVGEIMAKQAGMPLLLAVTDLKRMRQLDGYPAALSADELAGQKAQFADHADLYGLLQASHALYKGQDPKTIMALLPDAARQQHFTPIAFSRQILRGIALSQSNDPNEAGFWRELLGGASPQYQRPLAEMGLAIRWQRNGQMDKIFAAGSPVTDTTIRTILLQSLASPGILRKSAQDSSRPMHERDVARFTLLYKDLNNGAYGDFASDQTLVPADANIDAGLYDFAWQESIPVGLFTKGKWSDGYECPSIAHTAAALARLPGDPKARLCLGDFYRLNGFDGFSLYRGDGSKLALGSGPDGFPGKSMPRSAIYAAIIASKTAAAEDRAYALYRAVMCYAPSGYNSCGGTFRTAAELEAAQAPKTLRKAWFTELKQRYPDSRWAKALRYYW